ncbi:DUF4123 domain-containing protein [Tritonibacter mobilis]|uniref:DUF4123 domain-containing protein n=1 Tax=Tritonibacter mobilis TaxID=379347 RepID=UPI001C09AB31|nr:DUF4123 domain-containing protein [Tritonibacter mobilis]MBU3033706.1 DUF4123 domain-containing protein [Tritonibacter mobilis]WHQ84318.1 DUF4123 domain-containing protein [Tritonibacter mobilis]
MQPNHVPNEGSIWIIDCSIQSARENIAVVVASRPSEALDVLRRWCATQSIADGSIQLTKPPAPLRDWLQTGYGDWDLLAVLSELHPQDPVRLAYVEPPVHASPKIASAVHIDPPIEAGFLDTQFGIHPKKTAPDAVHSTLWGSSSGCFVVLDAAREQNLPERLADSGLRHTCLFEGQASEDLGAAAPWLVELSPESALMRELFTRTPDEFAAERGLTGLFLCSDDDLTEVKAHLRQFIRLQDEAGNWVYFRFWEGLYLFGLFEALAQGELAEFGRLFVSRKAMIASFSFMDSSGSWHVARLSVPRESLTVTEGNSALIVTEQLRQIFRSQRERRFVRRLRLHLNEILRTETTSLTVLTEAEVINLVHEARQFGMTLERSVADYAQARMMTPQGFARAPWFTALQRKNLHQLDFAQAVLEHCGATC